MQGKGSIYSKAPNGSRGSLTSTRTSASSAYTTSTSSLSSIPEITEDDEPVATPTPTVTTFAGKLIKSINKASRSSHFPRHNVSSVWHFLCPVNLLLINDGQTKTNADPPMKRRNASRGSVSSCRSQGSEKSCWTREPPYMRAI